MAADPCFPLFLFAVTGVLTSSITLLVTSLRDMRPHHLEVE